MTDKPVLPADIRLMNAVATLLFAAAGLLLCAVLLAWAARLPMFEIKALRIAGEASHYNAITLRANVLPRLQGTFFTLDLRAARLAFETLPWVRQAVVRRDFPNRLKVQLQEHQPVAFWGEEGDQRLINTYGEVFDANVGELEKEDLPRLNGPTDQSAQVLAVYLTLQPQFEPMDLSMVLLELTPRGGWHAELNTGTLLELGSGSAAELSARAASFLKTVTQVAARYQRSPAQLISADLRHSDGYAVRLAGVSTQDGDSGKKQ